MELEKVYTPQRFEPHWSEWWIVQGIFKANPQHPGKPWSIVIPPPNVTGSLHMGHMLEHTEIDVTTRWHRMRGDNTLWVPGMDHAGIATQMVVERQLLAEGKSRLDLGRERFEECVWEWKEQYGGRIVQQMIRIGASCDWSRARFTLDEGLSRAVRETFVRLYDKGLIYRGEYMVNWCPRCRTALSDLETVHEDVQGSMWQIRYPVNGTDDSLVVATTRPETMLGDTAVAINARDSRYLHLHGKTVKLPLMNRDIPIILDDMADPQFGTGAVKITPAHDPNDFEAGRRHDLPKIKVINESAQMTEAAGEFAGLDRFEARKRVVAKLEAEGYLVKTEPHTLSLGRCQRCKTIVEPLISLQWFVKTKPLAEPAIKVVEDGRLQFVPENWTKVYFDWMRNIRDWCISRQLWWGHRIPAWHCGNCHQITVSRQDPDKCIHCGSADIHQDPDVLDTWFSSGLWPFSTLGWPDKTEDYTTYYPTTLLNTGFDILFFWVARMVMLGIECTGEVPFRQVYIHGLIRDAEKQKMSKTKGNTIDPLEVTEKYGTDAVRMSLLLGAAPGTDIVLTEERMESSRAFANKIWNAARFIHLNMERSGIPSWLPREQECCLPEGDPSAIIASLEDRWIFSRLNRCAELANRAIEQHRYHEAAQVLWHYFWHEFCDWYLEMKKLRFQENSGLNADWRNLLTMYEMSLRLLHPVMPFLTEELWQRLVAESPDRPKSIALARYPQYNSSASDFLAEREWSILEGLITATRNLRADMKIDPKLALEGVVYARNGAGPVVETQLAAIQKMTAVSLEVQSGPPSKLTGAVRSTPEFDLLLKVPKELSAAMRTRIEKDNQQLEKNLANLRRQLENDEFVKKVPATVLEGMRLKLAEYESQLAKNKETLEGLG